MIRFICLLLGMLFVFEAHAFPCFITLVKDTCWANYNVTVDVMSSENGKKRATVLIPEGTAWSREKFECKPGDTLQFQATFFPVFWEKDRDRKYAGKSNWPLPQKPKKDETAWNLVVCFAKDFSEIPFPPDAEGNCRCETKDIPPVKPQ